MNLSACLKALLLPSFMLANSASAQFTLPSMEEFRRVSANGATVLQLTIDNDSLLLQRDDGFYTSGNQISSRRVLNNAQNSVSYGWQLGQDLYTASDIKLRPEQISSNDHPYAGWLYAGVFRANADAGGASSRFSLELGCFGPCAGGERTQTQLHRVINQPKPQGWDTQLQQEWGVVLSGEWSPSRWLSLESVDLLPKFKMQIGNIFTNASVDAILRFGQLSQLPEQSANFGFVRGEVKAIAYDATIQGGYFNHQQLSPQIQRSVGELELGYQWRSADFSVGVSMIRRSTGIRNLPNGLGAQNFARLRFNYSM
jgi:lipid A 3-O-deacylase